MKLLLAIITLGSSLAFAGNTKEIEQSQIGFKHYPSFSSYTSCSDGIDNGFPVPLTITISDHLWPLNINSNDLTFEAEPSKKCSDFDSILKVKDAWILEGTRTVTEYYSKHGSQCLKSLIEDVNVNLKGTKISFKGSHWFKLGYVDLSFCNQ